jgi:ubiquinol-cytochrome c reductase cytochrome c1 subunit
MKRILLLSILIIGSFGTLAANEHIELKKIIWPFDGMLGTVDREAAQRGYQVYKEVCSACHSLSKLSYRNLKDIGITEPEIKEIAKQYTLTDGPNDQGEMFQRSALPSDRFVAPFANEQAARAANNGAYPVDLSLIVKARPDGANYLYSLLTGYENPPSDFKMMDGLYYNKYFHGHQIAMPNPLSDGMVQYSSGTASTIDQMARDVVIFLQWAAEPEMEHRKSMGLKVLIYLAIFTVFFYFAKCRIWSRLK